MTESQCRIIGQAPPSSWDDYEACCIATFGGGYRTNEEREIFHHGMSTVFNLLRAEFPSAEQCKASTFLLKACQTMLEAYRLIPVPDCDDEQSCEEYRGLEAARQNLLNAIAKATTKEPSNGPTKVS